MRNAVAAFTALMSVVLLPIPAAAAPQTMSLAALARQPDITPGKTLVVTVKLNADDGYRQIKTKLVEISESTLRVRLGEDLSGLRTDLPLEEVGAAGTNLPFAEHDYAIIDIPEDRILRVAKLDSLANGALIGAGIGAAPAVLLVAAWCRGEPCDPGGSAAAIGFSAALGAGIGVLADYGREKEGTVLFEAPSAPQAAELSLAPILSSKRRGALLVINW